MYQTDLIRKLGHLYISMDNVYHVTHLEVFN